MQVTKFSVHWQNKFEVETDWTGLLWWQIIHLQYIITSIIGVSLPADKVPCSILCIHQWFVASVRHRLDFLGLEEILVNDTHVPALSKNPSNKFLEENATTSGRLCTRRKPNQIHYSCSSNKKWHSLSCDVAEVLSLCLYKSIVPRNYAILKFFLTQHPIFYQGPCMD